ncbi:MAG TPA: succinate dehydrogenase/fumarate reductase iron-sulfur subunit [Turneriella sp.]|nr:succinate dehydrogenase/fumarate reductase iron-sulfur subunit [Turneriella sp.]
MKLKLKIWRQNDQKTKGAFKNYQIDNVNEHMSFLEMLDVLNEDLTHKGEEPVAFSHDCREGICGSCAMVINGHPHGPEHGTATCQLHMRKFNGQSVTVEPLRAKAFPVLKDLVVDRSAFDRVQQAGGYITVSTGSAPEANLTPVPKATADEAFLAAQCIGCGACVAACKNASAMLFVAAKVSHLALMPQGDAERADRVRKMVKAMDDEGFGNCTNTGACEAECPKEISISHIARMNREYFTASIINEN